MPSPNTRLPGASPASLAIEAPAQGERWAAGSRHYVAWTSAPGTSARVEYSADSGRSWQTAIDARSGAPAGEVPCSVEGKGSLLWQVPDRPGPARIRVSGVAGGADVARAEAGFDLIPSQEVRDYRWTEVTLDAAFAARDGAGALTFGGRMWLLGGWNPKDKVYFPRICNSEVWSSADGRDWRLETRQAPWEGRHTAGYAVHRGRMWIVGGDVNQGHYQPDVWSSADGANWELICERTPWGDRALHYTVVHDGRIWIMGGQALPQKTGGAEVFYNDVWYSIDGRDWTLVTEHAPWSARGMIGGAAVMNGRIWLLGGGTYDTPATPTRKFHNDVWSTADGLSWTRHVEAAPWHPRQYHEVAVYDDRLWVMEGWGGGTNRNDVFYSKDGVNWYELSNTPWAPRHAASVFVFDGGLWMVAGNNMFSDAWKLTRAGAG